MRSNVGPDVNLEALVQSVRKCLPSVSESLCFEFAVSIRNCVSSILSFISTPVIDDVSKVLDILCDEDQEPPRLDVVPGLIFRSIGETRVFPNPSKLVMISGDLIPYSGTFSTILRLARGSYETLLLKAISAAAINVILCSGSVSESLSSSLTAAGVCICTNVMHFDPVAKALGVTPVPSTLLLEGLNSARVKPLDLLVHSGPGYLQLPTLTCSSLILRGSAWKPQLMEIARISSSIISLERFSADATLAISDYRSIADRLDSSLGLFLISQTDLRCMQLNGDVSSMHAVANQDRSIISFVQNLKKGNCSLLGLEAPWADSVLCAQSGFYRVSMTLNFRHTASDLPSTGSWSCPSCHAETVFALSTTAHSVKIGCLLALLVSSPKICQCGNFQNLLLNLTHAERQQVLLTFQIDQFTISRFKLLDGLPDAVEDVRFPTPVVDLNDHPGAFFVSWYLNQASSPVEMWGVGGDLALLANSLQICFNLKPQGGRSRAEFWISSDSRFVLKSLIQAEERFLRENFATIKKYVEAGESLLVPIFAGFTVNGLSWVVMKYLGPSGFDLKGFKRSSGSLRWDTCFSEMLKGYPLVLPRNQFRNFQVWLDRDVEFLASLHVVDYSLYVSDEEISIIDYLREFTWDKRIESVVKATASTEPTTVVDPLKYANRFKRGIKSLFTLHF